MGAEDPPSKIEGGAPEEGNPAHQLGDLLRLLERRPFETHGGSGGQDRRTPHYLSYWIREKDVQGLGVFCGVEEG